MVLHASSDESAMPMLQQQNRDEEDIPLDDNASDITRVGYAAMYGKAAAVAAHVRERSPSNLSSWSDSYRSSTLTGTGTRRRRQWMTTDLIFVWFRWGVVVLLQATIILLLWGQNVATAACENQAHRHAAATVEKDAVLKGKVVETGDDINGIYKTLSHSYTYLKPDEDRFIPNMTSNDNRLEIRRNWDMLMPLGSGSVAIPEYKEHPLLGDPITDDPIRSGPLYEASWTHALHCLYYSVDSYHQLIVNGRSDDDNPYHASHCFEYLRNSILCNLDMTLEGSMSTPQDKERGQPHVCRNREEAIRWIEERRVDDLQDIVGP